MTEATKTPTLAEFLLARIAEDEERARSGPADWDSPDAFKQDQAHDCQPHEYRCAARGERCRCELPARLLAECEAKRRIIARADYIDCFERSNDSFTIADIEYHEHVLPLLALPYSDHPDYREEWAQ